MLLRMALKLSNSHVVKCFLNLTLTHSNFTFNNISNIGFTLSYVS